ncbi:MAG TPA: hypothetical protein VEX18_08330 [Polyangiaceae bacterium]|nr:hypothetical protein [Polyangiaceae bacterium]
MRRLFSGLALSVLMALAVSGCGDEMCEAGEPCECFGGTDCYLGCEDDGCNATFHDLHHCGAVCEDDCRTESFRFQECSTTCGDDCNVLCHEGTACGALCGDRCRFECFKMDRCGARVGNDSLVKCHEYSRCEVECEGSCRVECANPTGCSVECLGGGAPMQCADGSQACGGC